jgi:predicted DsbA family dithiol-disulfide isomerase
MGGKSTADWLASQEGVKEVRDEEQTGLQLGIRAVPYFHIEGRPGLSGAQPPSIIADWLSQAVMTSAASATNAE